MEEELEEGKIADGAPDVEAQGGGAATEKGSSPAGDVDASISGMLKGAVTSRSPQWAQKAAQTAQRVRNAAHAVQAAVSNFFGAITNPATWIGVAAVVVTLALLNHAGVFSSLIGKDNLDECVGGTGGASSAINIPAGGANDPESYKAATDSIMAWLMTTGFTPNGGKPMSKEQAAGFVSNLQMETSNYDPTLVQGGADLSQYSNDQIIAYANSQGSGGGAVGIFQLRGSSLAGLGEYANSAGKKWSDADAQFEYVKTVLDTGKGFAGDMTRFWQAGHDVRYYASTSNRSFEGSCRLVSDDDTTGCAEGGGNWRAKGEEQYQKAQAAFDGFTGAGRTVGGSCVSKGGSADLSSTVSLAVSAVWPPAQHQQAVCGNDPSGACAKPEYKDIRAKLAEKGLTWPNYADCGMFVATMVIPTLDKEFPQAGTAVQYPYMMEHSDKWKPYYSKSEAQPGDVWITKPGEMGHVVLWVGQQEDGASYTAEASWDSHSGKLQPDRFNDSLVDEMGRQYVGFHFVGTPDPAL